MRRLLFLYGKVISTSLFSVLLSWGIVQGGGFSYVLPRGNDVWQSAETVVGLTREHIVSPKETLLDIARNYGLGFNEMQLLYPDMDPWIPKAGTRLLIPSQWVLPPTERDGVVINLPELRLYRFFPKIRMVKSYPVGIGDLDSETPEGSYRVVDRQVDPTWVIPPSVRHKYEVSQIPPGPANPLGKFWLGLSRKGYGIHGTNFPWAVGRLISRGCIRLYPEHIEQLFKEVPVGTPVEIISEPVKIGLLHGDLFVEIHPDAYGRELDIEAYARKRLQDAGLWQYVSSGDFETALRHRNGVPFRVGSVKKGGDRGVVLRGAVPSLMGKSIHGNDKKEVIR